MIRGGVAVPPRLRRLAAAVHTTDLDPYSLAPPHMRRRRVLYGTVPVLVHHSSVSTLSRRSVWRHRVGIVSAGNVSPAGADQP